MSLASRLSFAVAVAVAVPACKGHDQRPATSGTDRSKVEGHQPPAPADKPDHAQESPLERKREELLMLDAALSKLEREIDVAEKAHDSERLAELREKQRVLQTSIGDAERDLRLMEFVKRRNEARQGSGDAGTNDLR